MAGTKQLHVATKSTSHSVIMIFVFLVAGLKFEGACLRGCAHGREILDMVNTNTTRMLCLIHVCVHYTQSSNYQTTPGGLWLFQ